MLKRYKTNVFSIIALVSFLLVLGSVGAMERNTVSLLQGTIQVIVFSISTVLFIRNARTSFDLVVPKQRYSVFFKLDGWLIIEAAHQVAAEELAREILKKPMKTLEKITQRENELDIVIGTEIPLNWEYHGKPVYYRKE